MNITQHCFISRAVNFILLSGLLQMSVLLGAGICWADERVQNQPQEKEISQVNARISRLESNIRFEEGWDEKLREANNKLKMLQGVNSELGELFRDIARALTKGASETKISRKIAEVNSKLEPFFKVDKKGSLQWGLALQVAGIQAQFIPGGITMLTPEHAVAVLSNWQQNNREKMEENKKELERLQRKLEGLQEDEASALSESQGFPQDARRQLDALTVRLNKDVEHILGLEKSKAIYDEVELEMKLHMAAIQQAENEVKRGNEILPTIGLGIQMTSEKLGEVREPMESLKGKTAKLNKAYKYYANASKAASKAADQVCDYAARAASDPPPSADEVMSWEKESNRIISRAAIPVEDADAEVRSLIRSMDSSISWLKAAIKRLDGFQRDTFLGLINQLVQIKSKLDNADKTLPRVKELRKTLETVSMRLTEYAPKLLDLIRKTRKRAGALAETVRGKNRNLEAELAKLQARIITADNKMQNILYSIDKVAKIPEVPELSSGLSDLLSKLKDIDRAEESKMFEKIDSTIAEGRKTISDAEGAVVAGAFATRNAPGEFKRARECYASLKAEPPEEETVARGQLAALKKRLAVVEGNIPELTRLKTRDDEELRSAAKSIKAHIDRAQQLMDDADAVADEIKIRFYEGITVAYPTKVSRLTQDLSARTQELEAAYERFAKAAGNATKTRDEICGYKEKASAGPPPSADEVKAWKGKSTELIEQTAIAFKIAADEVSGKRNEVTALAGELKPLLDDYKNNLTLFLAVEKTVLKLRKDMDDAEKELEDARDIRNQEATSQIIALYKRYELINEVRAIILELNMLGETADSKLKSEVLKLTGRAKSAEQRLTGMPELHPSEQLPEVPRSSIPRRVSDFYYMYRTYKLKGETMRMVNQTLAYGRKAISDAVSARELGRFATERAPQILEEARQCYASLKKAEEAIQKKDEKIYADAQAALNSCDFEKARSLIDQMPAGPKKTELDQEYRTSVSLKDRLKALVSKANGEYKGGHYETALSTLEGALSQAKCDKHIKSINKKIAQVNVTVLKVYNNAKAALNSCDFEKARSLIDQMPAGLKKTELDQEYRTSVSLKDRLKALVSKANGEYKGAHYETALSTLEGALGQTKCDRHRESINKKIAKIMGKLGPTPEEQVAAKVPSVRGENVEIAKMIIRDAKMVPSVNREKRTFNENEVDKVYAQRPSAGSPATQGDTVIIYVYSKAKGEITPAPPQVDEEGKPYYVVFELWSQDEPREKKPEWYYNKPPVNADKDARKKFHRELNNKKIQWINGLTVSKKDIVHEIKTFVVILFTGDSLKVYSREYFNGNKEFSLPMTVQGLNVALLLKVKNVFGGLEGVRSVHPAFKPKKNDPSGGLEINSERGYTTIAGIGPLTEGWSPTNMQKSLVISKIVMKINLTNFMGTILPF